MFFLNVPAYGQALHKFMISKLYLIISPQRWAYKSGFGCALLKDPELVKDLTMTLRRNFPSEFSVSVKIRVQKPLT